MRRIVFFLFIASGLIFSCESGRKQLNEQSQIQTGSWRGVLKVQDTEIPFLFDVVESGGNYQVILKNAEESILIDDVEILKDSIHIPMHIFDATIHARISGDGLEGVYIKNYLDDYQLAFEAKYGENDRFQLAGTGEIEPFTGKWEVDFIEEDGIDKAIGLFEAYEGHLKGTFVTSTGDYRFLEGAVVNDTMKLSTFDGTHAYLFFATINEEGQLSGDFWSGKTWHQSWTAVRNEDFELPDPYSMTYMKEGYDKFEIKFPNASGNLVELDDEAYQNKVVVIQLLGTWCPNCMDETKFYVEWIKTNPSKEVAFLGLAFERKADAEYAFGRIEKMKAKLDVPYEVLLAGTTDQESRSKSLPMLNKIMSFPTSIILDKQHNVRKIHTGFSGPGTGEYYERYVEEFNRTIDKLLGE